jgi:hypothetical protein
VEALQCLKCLICCNLLFREPEVVDLEADDVEIVPTEDEKGWGCSSSKHEFNAPATATCHHMPDQPPGGFRWLLQTLYYLTVPCGYQLRCSLTSTNTYFDSNTSFVLKRLSRRY